ncbi:DEAD-box ATP-dependent RNA helicase [Chytridiales sp. JEL 0842]|nr:DEAD-box ATP-dependent RNA helicase [Chytridiales sp. JEL 0842]
MADEWGGLANAAEDSTAAFDASQLDGEVKEKRTHKFGPQDPMLPSDFEGETKWMANARLWNEGESDESLANELFNSLRVGKGDAFAKVLGISVEKRGADIPPAIKDFSELNLHPLLVDNLKLMNYTEPTPIQAHVIPTIMSHRDVMACAQTGSGKTAAYIIPVVNKMLKKGKEYYTHNITRGAGRQVGAPTCLVISPTRELACQIFDEFRKFCYLSWVKPCVVYGGVSEAALIQNMNQGCHILIATPGRLMHMLETRQVTLSKVKFLIIDEADRLLDMGFEPDMRQIVHKQDMCQDESRLTMLFSATFPREDSTIELQIRVLARDFVQDVVLITVGRVGVIPTTITQMIYKMGDGETKSSKLLDLLYEQEAGQTIIFVQTKRSADTLDDFLHTQGFPVTSIHSERNQKEREDAINSFKANRTPILIATDVAGRGWDIPNVLHVINYDMPKSIEDYVHRIGRTGRAGNPGFASSFYDPDHDAEIASDLVKVLKQTGTEIPEFLAEYNQEDDEAEKEAQTLREEDMEGEMPDRSNANGGYGNGGGEDGDAGGWGSGGGGEEESAAGGWGSSEKTGWGANGGTTTTDDAGW